MEIIFSFVITLFFFCVFCGSISLRPKAVFDYNVGFKSRFYIVVKLGMTHV